MLDRPGADAEFHLPSPSPETPTAAVPGKKSLAHRPHLRWQHGSAGNIGKSKIKIGLESRRHRCGGGSAPKSSEARVRLSYPSPSMARYEIPNQLPEFVECGDALIPSNEATLEEWQRHKNPDKSVNQILKLAAKLALPDNTPLLPRLRALARANVLAFNRKF